MDQSETMPVSGVLVGDPTRGLDPRSTTSGRQLAPWLEIAAKALVAT